MKSSDVITICLIVAIVDIVLLILRYDRITSRRGPKNGRRR